MKLKSIVDDALKQKGQTFKWLVAEVGISNDGLKAGIENETIKFKDLKKLAQVLNIPIQILFEGNTSIQSQKGGKYNHQTANSMLMEPENDYVKGLKEQLDQVKSQLQDKDKIIELLSKK